MEREKISFSQFESSLSNTKLDYKTIKQYGITTKDKIFEGDFSYTGEIALSFDNCHFINGLTFFNYIPTATIYIKNCMFLNGIRFIRLKTDCKISFLDCVIEDLLIIIDSNINELQLNNKFCKRLQFDDNSSLVKVDIGGKERNIINEIYLKANIIEKRLTIDNVESLNVRLSYSTLSQELNIFNSKINSLELENFRNNGFFRLLNCTSLNVKDSPSKLVISRSNLGFTEFYNFDFASFNEINISNSILIRSMFIGSKWAKKIVSVDTFVPKELTPRSSSESKLYEEKIREVYKQIKLALSKQGNYIEEQYFHGLEMNSYQKSLSWNSNFWTKLILKLSFYSSNYGQSILRPILFLLIFNGALYSILCYESCQSLHSINNISAKSIINIFSNFLWYMNPLHKNEPELKGILLIIDIFIRIISSYCIYNIIRASRRFIK